MDVQTLQPDWSLTQTKKTFHSSENLWHQRKTWKRLHDCENSQDQVEGKKKQISNEMEASGNSSDATVVTAEDSNDGLIQQRKSRKTDTQQLPIENEEHDSGPTLPLREVKNKNKQWHSTESVTSSVSMKARTLFAGLLQAKCVRKLQDTVKDGGRSAKKTSNGMSKVKKQVSAVDDFDDLSQSSKTPLEDSESRSPQYNTLVSE